MKVKSLFISLVMLFSLIGFATAETNAVNALVGQGGGFNTSIVGDQTIVIASYVNNTSFNLPPAKKVWSEKAGGGMYVIYIVVDTQEFVRYVTGLGYPTAFPLYINTTDYYLIIYGDDV